MTRVLALYGGSRRFFLIVAVEMHSTATFYSFYTSRSHGLGVAFSKVPNTRQQPPPSLQAAP